MMNDQHGQPKRRRKPRRSRPRAEQHDDRTDLQEERPPITRTLTERFHSLASNTQKTIGGAALVVLLIVIWSLSRIDASAARQNTGLPMEFDEAVAARREARALSTSRRQDAAHRANSALAAVSELESRIRRWNELGALETNDEGKLIASDPTSVRVFSAALAASRASAEDAARLREVVNTLIQPVRDAETEVESIYNPGDSILTELSRQKATAQAAVRVYDEHLATVEVLLREARQNNAPAPITLEEALQRRADEVARENAALIEARVADATRTAAELEAEAKAEQVVELGKQRAAAIREETKLLEGKARRERLQEQAEDPAIRALFKPFLTKGRNRVGIINDHRFPYPVPASVNDLLSRGSLRSAQRFAECGSGKSKNCRNNDRPKWKHPNTEREWNEMRRRYKLFMDLKDIWLEKGLLTR